MRVRFWGVRGSVPWTTADSAGCGCNTPCVEVRDDRTGDVLVLDAGTGIVGLGHTLVDPSVDVPILLTHYHWDHVQGLPYFTPLFGAERRASIWGPRLGAVDAACVRTMFDPPFFPLSYRELPSHPAIHTFTEQRLTIGRFDIRAQPLNHPGGAMAYRIAGERGDLVYATDHEIGVPDVDEALGAFARGARAVIMSAHFTPEELPSFAGWGHSSWEQSAAFAAAHDVGRLWLFHHKPGRSDAAVDALCEQARRIFKSTDAAREGEMFEI